MKGLDNFTTLIQLISAVNFAYIIPFFHQKVYDTIFNEKKFYSEKIGFFKNLMKVEQGTLEEMRENAKNEMITAIDTLIDQYKILKIQWEGKMAETKYMIDWVKNRKGFKSLFLFSSLFCIVDLLNIAIVNTYNNNIYLVFTHFITIIAFIYVLKLIYKILFSGWKKKDDDYCYKRAIRYFVQTIFFAFFGTLIFYWLRKYYSIPIYEWITSIVVILSIAIPFIPCVFTFLFMFIGIKFVYFYTKLSTKAINKEQEDLNASKRELEEKNNFIKHTSWG